MPSIRPTISGFWKVVTKAFRKPAQMVSLSRRTASMVTKPMNQLYIEWNAMMPNTAPMVASPNARSEIGIPSITAFGKNAQKPTATASPGRRFQIVRDRKITAKNATVPEAKKPIMA